MAYERKDGDIVVFKNNRKQEERQPDMTGSALINGVEYSVSFWTKEGTNGKFLSGRIEERQARRAEPSDFKPEAQGEDNDLPF